MSSTDNQLTSEDRATLLRVARQSIEHGLRHGRTMRVDPGEFAESLRSIRATFVTLQLAGNLRGCIGTLEPREPLVVDVAEHAYAAAFEDPRFKPLSVEEFLGLELHVSILSPAEPIHFNSEQELLAQLRPKLDGLILRLGHHRATFLPSVWDTLSKPEQFLAHLKQKAGLAPDFWSDRMEFERYGTDSFGEAESGSA
jgi:AmmeMemoRadiSam system protein A